MNLKENKEEPCYECRAGNLPALPRPTGDHWDDCAGAKSLDRVEIGVKMHVYDGLKEVNETNKNMKP